MDTSKIETIRKRKGKTQLEVAQAAGITDTGYQKLIKTGDLKVSTLEKISVFLGVDILTFFGDKKLDQVKETGEKYNTADKSCDDLRELNGVYRTQYDADRATINALNSAVAALTAELRKYQKAT